MRVELIENYLDNLIPNPKCELEFSKDYELLISIMLSAQTTDKRVNKVTRVLFKKYDSLEKLKSADLKDLKDIVRELGSYNKKAVYVKEIARIIVDDYNGIMPRKRKELEIPNDDIVIGHIGTFRKVKNHNFLINIFFELYKKNKKYKF